jgi:hypothetical protein
MKFAILKYTGATPEFARPTTCVQFVCISGRRDISIVFQTYCLKLCDKRAIVLVSLQRYITTEAVYTTSLLLIQQRIEGVERHSLATNSVDIGNLFTRLDSVASSVTFKAIPTRIRDINVVQYVITSYNATAPFGDCPP